HATLAAGPRERATTLPTSGAPTLIQPEISQFSPTQTPPTRGTAPDHACKAAPPPLQAGAHHLVVSINAPSVRPPNSHRSRRQVGGARRPGPITLREDEDRIRAFWCPAGQSRGGLVSSLATCRISAAGPSRSTSAARSPLTGACGTVPTGRPDHLR